MTLMPFEKGRVGTVTVFDEVTLDEAADDALDEVADEVLDEVADEVLDEVVDDALDEDADDVLDEDALEEAVEDVPDEVTSEEASSDRTESLDASEEPAASELLDRLLLFDDLIDEASPLGISAAQEQTDSSIGTVTIIHKIRKTFSHFTKHHDPFVSLIVR